MLGIALIAAVIGTAAGIRLGREYFGRSLQANIQITPGVDVSLVGDTLENLIILLNKTVSADRNFEPPLLRGQRCA